MIISIISTLLLGNVFCDNYSFVNIPNVHLPYYLSNYRTLAEQCHEDVNCPFREHLNSKQCWGYEHDCAHDMQFSQPTCPGEYNGWAKTKKEQLELFYNQADFGFIREQYNEMKVICEPLFPDDSSLDCSDHLRFCRGRNIMMNFTSLAARNDPIRYKMDVLNDGDIGGYCKLHSERITDHLDHMSPLQSWAPELRFFKKLDKRPTDTDNCDIIVTKPTILMKIDATVNMYHHFCDFFNLYASLHLNTSNIDIFSTDVQILIWESYTYRSAFEDTFKAFTKHPILDLKTYRGKNVCFKNLLFPLLPRMIFGLYYNTPVIHGCENSGLFRAFSEFLTHRLDISLHQRTDKRIRVTLLSRDTKYRRIINENELLDALEDDEDYVVKRVVFNKDVSFLEQVEIVRNSDVFIGMHGAGLTHLLFMEDWGAVFELYNCEDPNCYMDLTRLRGLHYVTWTDLEKIQKDETILYEGAAHAKFTNYLFDVDEFVRLVKSAAEKVKTHPKFRKYIQEQNIQTVSYGTILEIHSSDDNDFEFDNEIASLFNVSTETEEVQINYEKVHTEL